MRPISTETPETKPSKCFLVTSLLEVALSP